LEEDMDVAEDLEAKRLKPVVRLLGVEDEEGRRARWWWCTRLAETMKRPRWKTV
jgi:hypothetical protein